MRNVLVSILALAGLGAAGEGENLVRIYVSLDREHSEALLRDFEKETGIHVAAEFDTEQTKTVGLVNRLIEEKQDPQADLYWNNELATTVKLKENGVLVRYESPSAEDIPAEFKDPDGTWVGFAARARVLVVNTDLVKPEEYPKSMWDLADPKWKGRVCMARPEKGTTAAHASALYTLDPGRADEYFDALVANEVAWLVGNGHCMREVAAGRFAVGWTDTDDFNVARLQGKPVAQVFPDSGAGDIGTMYIPNSLVKIRGGKHPKAAQKLIDWLLRPEVEERLAHSATAQIPVRPGVKVPENVKRADQIGKVMALDWDRVGREWDKWVAHVRAKLVSQEEASGTLIWVIAGVALVVVAVGVLLKRATGEPS